MMSIKRKNHFVPRFYLRRWAKDGHKIYVFRKLVSHRNVPYWELKSINSTAICNDLYTESVNDTDIDDLENEIAREYEKPAEEPIDKAINGIRLTSQDWKYLIRFVALQQVRTTSSLLKSITRNNDSVPIIIDNTLDRMKARLGDISKRRYSFPQDAKQQQMAYLPPINVDHREVEGTNEVEILIQVSIGQKMWLYEIRHIIHRIVEALYQHKWVIGVAHDNVFWPTSDDPVICLNYYGNGSYDFKGGWRRRNAEIILPISPKHIVYTCISHNAHKEFISNFEVSSLVQKIIIEHAFRNVFSLAPIKNMTSLISREVNSEKYRLEQKYWTDILNPISRK